ncbi:MAG: glycoside hydrolase family 55 protein, partial [Verrucomicrobia bacterium]|nr:glycoside hydrolase family 55 protein [Verrucomicrobiota bacterium]
MISGNWRLASPQHLTNELIITPFDALADFGIVADGVTDVTDEIQEALILLGNMGGGALFLPEGHYKVNGNLVIPSGVTLRGDWRQPIAGEPILGTVLMAYAGRGDENAVPFIKLNNSAGVNGLSIWYPEQLPNDIQPYPPTIARGGGATIENVTLVNAYFGYTTYVDGTTARPFVRHIYGTPLKTGIEFDCLADIGRIETVHFSPDYWAGSGLPHAPTAGEHEAWIYNNGTGMIVRRIDWSYSCYVTVEGYNIGLALRPGRFDGKVPNGQSYGFNLRGCKTGVHIEASAYAGYQFTRFDIQQAEIGVYLAPSAVEADMFHSCSINASSSAVFSEGPARVLMMSCDVQQGPIRLDAGYLSIINSDFAATPANHIELGGAVAGASILGNRFTGGARIIDNTAHPVNISHAPVAADPLPAYDYRKPESIHRPAKTNLYVVTEAPYNAQADGVTDDTAAFQAALAAAGANGGGTVFVPGGNYRLNGTLTVPTGVELRGVFDTPNDTKVKGSLLNVYAGRNNASGTPFIQLEAGSSIKGFTFHYPEQIYDALDTVNFGMVPYPFLLRGLGADITIANLSATIPYQLLDLASHQCDRHYVDYIFSTALKTGIHVGHGSVDGQIHNCQFNPSAYTHAGLYYDSIPTGTADNIHKILWRDATPYLFGHMTNEVLHQNFVFGGAKGFHLVPEGGFGPSGHCLGMGVDQCTIAMQIDDVGEGGLAPINSQIVTVNPTDGHYLETGASLTDTFKMFSSAGWGSHAHSAVINGGDVRLQLFHISPAAKVSALEVLNSASLKNLGGNQRESLPAGRPYLTVSPMATATIVGNIINTTAAQMPVASPNVTSLGNLRVGDAAVVTDRLWSNGSGNRVWNQAANWNGGVVPGIGNRATIGNDALPGPIIGVGVAASVKNIAIGDLASTGDQLELVGGSLTTTEWLILGYGDDNAGVLNVGSGSVSIGGDLFVGLHGAGALNLGGGTLTVVGRLIVAPYPGSTGNITLEGGTLSVGSLHMTDRGSLDITDGTLLIAGDATAIVNAYISNGWLTAVGGTTTPFVDYDNLNPGKTTVAVLIPPVTTTVWNPVANGLWTTDANWTGGVAPMSQIQNLKVVFNVHGAQECILSTYATVAQLSMGDNGTTNGNALRLVNGADLTCGLNATNGVLWTGVGYNRPATLTVEGGAQVTCRSHLWVGFVSPAVGTVDINGGTVNVDGMFGLGWSGGLGYVHVRNGGVLDLSGFHPTQSITNGSVLNIESGSVIINGNQTGPVNDYVLAGRIVAYQGAGTVSVDYGTLNPGRTTVWATAPLSGYELWAQGWVVPIGSTTNDFDGDRLSNLGEYGLNGNPTNALDAGSAPRLDR